MINNTFYVVLAKSSKGIVRKSKELPIYKAYDLYKLWAETHTAGRIVVRNRFGDEIERFNDEWLNDLQDRHGDETVNKILRNIEIHSSIVNKKIKTEVRLLHSTKLSGYTIVI